MSNFGYAGKILQVDLSQKSTSHLPTEDYTDRFIGGRGIAAKLYWDNVSPQTGAFDPDNMLIFAPGPLAGFTRIGGPRWNICGKSPAMEPQWFSYCNLGGSWGSWLKFAGYDGITVKGRSDKPVYLFVNNGKAEIRDAAHLWGKNATETREALKAELGKEVRVAAIAPAGENLVSFAGILADEDSHGASGFGGVMGSKKLKAVAVVGNQKPAAAQPEKLNEVIKRVFELRGQHGRRHSRWVHEGYTKRYACYGCVAGCGRQNYRTSDGRQVKFYCHFGDMYEEAAINYYGKWDEVIVHATDLIHKYTLDSFVMEPMILWLGRCYQEGILGEKETGLPLSKIGTAEFIEALVRKISFREGFGDTLALGTFKAAEIVGKGSQELIGDSISTRSNDFTMYDPRMYIITGILYATEPRKAIQQLHEITGIIHQWVGQAVGGRSEIISPEVIATIAEKFWGSRAAGDFSTYEGKGLAAKKIQDREYAKESLVLCDAIWPILWAGSDKIIPGDPTLESQIFSAVTGRETDKAGLDRLGESIFNLQRAIRLREGWMEKQGDRLLDTFYEVPIKTARFNEDCLVPGKDGVPVSRKGFAVERDKFDNMLSEYYELRGWDINTGLPTLSRLRELDLEDVAEDLKKGGLLSL